MRNFDREFGQQVINNLYAVFLGIVLSATFSVDTKNGIVDFAVDANWLALILLIIYYLLDWFSSIFTIRNDSRINYIHLYLFVLANIVLCASILFAINNSCELFIVFGLYSFLVPLWDFFVSARKLEGNGNVPSRQRSYFGMTTRSILGQLRFVTSFRFIFGFVLFFISFLSYWFFGGNNEEAQIISYSMLILIVFVKWIRMTFLFKFYRIA